MLCWRTWLGEDPLVVSLLAPLSSTSPFDVGVVSIRPSGI
jgi:hypothetical protein